MYYITIKGDISNSQARSMGFLTGMDCYYDPRFKQYEFRGAKGKHFKYLKVFEALGKVLKCEVRDWVAKEGIYHNKYVRVK